MRNAEWKLRITDSENRIRAVYNFEKVKAIVLGNDEEIEDNQAKKSVG